MMRVIHSVHRHVTREDCPMKPPTIGPKIGPMKAALANTGNANTRSIGDQRSEMEPPAHVSGVEPKNPRLPVRTSSFFMDGEVLPARNRKTS